MGANNETTARDGNDRVGAGSHSAGSGGDSQLHHQSNLRIEEEISNAPSPTDQRGSQPAPGADPVSRVDSSGDSPADVHPVEAVPLNPEPVAQKPVPPAPAIAPPSLLLPREQRAEISQLLPREQGAEIIQLLPREQKKAASPQPSKRQAVKAASSLGSKTVPKAKVQSAKTESDWLRKHLPKATPAYWEVRGDDAGFVIKLRWREREGSKQPNQPFPRISREQYRMLKGSSYTKEILEDRIYGHVEELCNDRNRCDRGRLIAAWLRYPVRNHLVSGQRN